MQSVFAPRNNVSGKKEKGRRQKKKMENNNNNNQEKNEHRPLLGMSWQPANPLIYIYIYLFAFLFIFIHLLVFHKACFVRVEVYL